MKKGFRQNSMSPFPHFSFSLLMFALRRTANATSGTCGKRCNVRLLWTTPNPVICRPRSRSVSSNGRWLSTWRSHARSYSSIQNSAFARPFSSGSLKEEGKSTAKADDLPVNNVDTPAVNADADAALLTWVDTSVPP